MVQNKSKSTVVESRFFNILTTNKATQKQKNAWYLKDKYLSTYNQTILHDLYNLRHNDQYLLLSTIQQQCLNQVIEFKQKQEENRQINQESFTKKQFTNLNLIQELRNLSKKLLDFNE